MDPRAGPASYDALRQLSTNTDGAQQYCGSQPSTRTLQAPRRDDDDDTSRRVYSNRASARPSDSPGFDSRVPHPPHVCAEYADEIIEHLLSRERTLLREPNYLANQSDVTERMRTILVDWLIDVHLKFKQHPETFYLAVDYVDRFLMLQKGTRSTLQLVGVCAILIAGKHEEIWPPEVRDCVYISANTYTKEDILSMEREITATLMFRLCVPTPYPFMCRLFDIASAPEDTRLLGSYCLDLAALEYQCLNYLPSRIGFAAVLIANIVMENQHRAANGIPLLAAPLENTPDATIVWDRAHSYYSRVSQFELGEVIACARCILSCAQAVSAPGSRYHAVKRKYTQGFGSVATRYTLPFTI